MSASYLIAGMKWHALALAVLLMLLKLLAHAACSRGNRSKSGAAEVQCLSRLEWKLPAAGQMGAAAAGAAKRRAVRAVTLRVAATTTV
jgi:hypothetical protein